MSKRDELRRLREAQKNVRSEETPAEDYSNSAAAVIQAESVKADPAVAETRKVPEELPERSESALEAEHPSTNLPQPMEKAEDEETNTISVYSVTNEPGKRISVSLRSENKNWMHRTAMRCGLSIQDYVNILILEAWEREKQHPYVFREEDPIPERIPSNQTVLVAIKLTNSNIEKTKRMRASHCMTMTYYMNYLIEEEMKREKEEGMRRAVFDDNL